MKFQVDHDYHIHSQLSICSNNPEQTPARLLQYAKDNNLHRICVTDHFWDETVPGAENYGFYREQPYDRIVKSKPLPQAEGIDFLFGCEIDMDLHGTIGLRADHFDRFDFVIIPTTHLHMDGIRMGGPPFTISAEDAQSEEGRARQWVWRFEQVLNQPLPFHKIGLAHLTCSLIAYQSREAFVRVMNSISTDDMTRLFKKAAEVGVGIELNAFDFDKISDSDADTVLRPYRIAKDCGCKFYLGGDAHQPHEFDIAIRGFHRAVDLLNLQESDKFHIG